MAAIAQKMAKIEEASRIRSEQTNNFIVATKEALDAKMDSHEEKREAYINELRARLKDHLEGVEKTRWELGFNFIYLPIKMFSPNSNYCWRPSTVDGKLSQ